MSKWQMSFHVTSTKFFKSTWMLPLLSLVMFIVVFTGCKPAAAPSTVSPLQTPAASPASLNGQSLAGTKEAMLKSIEQTQVAARLTPRPTDWRKKLTPSPEALYTHTPGPTVFVPIPESTPAGSGAIGQMLPLFFVHQINVTNAWFEDTAGGTKRTYIFAGSKPGQGGEITQQGLVIVQVAKMSPQGDVSVIYYKEFLTPTQSGSVSITGAVGERLTLQTSNGTNFYFDVPSYQFVSSLTAVVPTATVSLSPLTTPTPAP